MIKSNSGELYTLPDFIREYSAEDIRINSFFLKQVFWDSNKMNHKIIVNESSIIDKYKEELEENKRMVEFTTKEYYRYKYNPKLLAYDVYGTTELWFMILLANELYTITEFDMRKVCLFDSAIITKINRMINLDAEFLEINSMEVKAETDEGVNL